MPPSSCATGGSSPPGQGVAVPANAERIDARGKWVAPGMISGLSQLGLTELEIGGDGADDVENDDQPVQRGDRRRARRSIR